MNNIYKNEKVSYDDAVNKSIEYFNGDQLAATVWINKYALKDSEGNIYELTPDDMHYRLANEIARIENNYPNPLSIDLIYSLLKDFKYIIPQGGSMAGIGNDMQVSSLSNCFVVGNQYDSYGGIMKTDEEQLQLMKRRGGVGHDISHIRPKGSAVKNTALTSTGIVPFMKRYSNSTREIAQDGRRGALMLTMSIKHPDIEDFIDAKTDLSDITGANISVKIDDDFMNCLNNNTQYIQQFPIDSQLPKITKTVDAQKIWQKIIHNAWKYAEPGVLFWDNIIKESISDCYADLGFITTSINPCFPASEYLLTENGYFKFGDLATNDLSKTNNVVCDKRISYIDDGGSEKPENWKIDNKEFGTIIRKASNVFLTQNDAEIIELKTSKGFKLKCTPDHHIATKNGMVKAEDLTPDDDILIAVPENNGSIIGKIPETKLEILGMLMGLFQGNGTSDKKRKRIFFDFWGDDAERMKELVCNSIDKLYEICGERRNNRNRKLSKYFIINNNIKIRIGSAWVGKIFEEHGYDFNNKFKVPEFIYNNSSNNVGKFYIGGLMHSDGCIVGSPEKGYSVRLSQSNEEFLIEIQRILHSNGMIFGIYKRRDAGLRVFPDGKGGSKKYKCKDNYELISLGGGIVKYMESIGFLGNVKKESKYNPNYNYRIKKSFTDNIVSITKSKNEPVFCIKEDIGRNIIVNGISTRRCGEVPLCPYDSCRLLAINLYSYVINPFTKNAYFDFDLFKQHVSYAQRIMDDIVDLEIEKINQILNKIDNDPEPLDIKITEKTLWNKIKEKAIQGRRIGIGITGEGDMLAALGLQYGSDEAIDFSEEVHKTLAINVYKSSVRLANERGAFPIFDIEKEKNNPFINRLFFIDPELKEEMIKYGRRNISMLTIAPTGSVSILTQTTSGIEPVFSIMYKRRRKVNPNDKNAKISFIDNQGDAWEEYNVFHPKFLIWLEINGYDINDIISNFSDDKINELIQLSPYYHATSSDIDWVSKVKMQGRIQKFVDHSISVTINLPENTKEDLVDTLYRTAWECGCKGITVYREGSRSGVLVSNNNTKNEFSETSAPKRPKKLEADVIRFKNLSEEWIAVIGILNNRPYEIFTGKADHLYIPKDVTKGYVIREKDASMQHARYDFLYCDKNGNEVVIDGLSNAFNPEFWNYAKLISGILRHGMPLFKVIELIDNLKFDNDNINTWKKGVIRSLKRYIPDGTKTGDKCPQCGAENSLQYKEGCVTCASCGYSKCG